MAAFMGCGEKSGPTLNFQFVYGGGNPFNDVNVLYVVFKAESRATGGKYLDSNGDGVPDVFAFPGRCIDENGSIIDACGYSPSEQDFTLSGIPLNFNYVLRAEFKNAAGTVLYRGESMEFLNTETTPTVTVNVTKL